MTPVTLLNDALATLHGPWLYPVIGLLAAAESAALIGLVVPGETAMVLGGVAVGLGPAGATTRVTDLETAWDQAQGRLKARDQAAWTRLDGKIDTVLTDLRASPPDAAAEKDALTALLADLG